MNEHIQILCAARGWQAMNQLRRELEQDERCTVQIVSTGPAALACAGRSAPDILVLDAVLPGMDGLGVMDRMEAMLESRMPKVIAGSMMPAADEGFRRRGVRAVLRIPWNAQELAASVRSCMKELGRIDWQRVQGMETTACALLEQMGMRTQLKGCRYLACCAAMAACTGEGCRMEGKTLYCAAAERFATTQESVERLIRHALESAMNENAGGMYAFFGNTIDPMRGKPTNAQAISAMAEKLRVI